MQKLYRSSTDKVLAGVCGGLAKYLNIDSSIIRLIWVLTVIFAGFGILLYIIAALIIPIEPYPAKGKEGSEVRSEPRKPQAPSSALVPLVIGFFLILVGLAAMGHNLGWHIFNWHLFYKIHWILIPSLIIIIGLILIFRSLAGAEEKTKRNERIASERLPDPEGEPEGKKATTPRKKAEKKVDTTSHLKTESKKKEKEKEMAGTTNTTGEKKLYRNLDNRMISGVCAGLADYLEMDVSLVRLLWVLITLFTAFFGGIIAYFIMVLVVPAR